MCLSADVCVSVSSPVVLPRSVLREGLLTAGQQWHTGGPEAWQWV